MARRRKVLLFLFAAIIVLAVATPAVYSKAVKTPGFCATCHIIEPHYQSWNQGDLLAAKHAEAGVKCIDCHQQSLKEKVVDGMSYITGNYEDPLKERDVDRESCMGCHEKGWDKVVEKTEWEMSNPHRAHLGEISCSLCHNMHRQSEVNCAQCHDFDWFKQLDKSWNVQTQ